MFSKLLIQKSKKSFELGRTLDDLQYELQKNYQEIIDIGKETGEKKQEFFKLSRELKKLSKNIQTTELVVDYSPQSLSKLNLLRFDTHESYLARTLLLVSLTSFFGCIFFY